MRLKKREGEVAQAIFVQYAMKQGLRVAEPIGDSDPYDYLVGDGVRFWRTQVKSTSTQLPNDTYQVCVSKLTGYRRNRHFVPYLPSELDFFAIVLVPEDSVYIVPIEIVDGRLGLTFHERNNPRFGRWRPYFHAFDLFRQTGEKPVPPPDEPNASSPRRKRPFGRKHVGHENDAHGNVDHRSGDHKNASHENRDHGKWNPHPNEAQNGNEDGNEGKSEDESKNKTKDDTQDEGDS